MKVVITSGPMQMNIDKVRKIENSSTGKLGTLFAQTFFKHNKEVVYIHSENALIPKEEGIKKILINNPKQLLSTLKDELKEDSIVIHLMAINDFAFEGSLSKEKFFDNILLNKENINNKEDLQLLVNNLLEHNDKISSKDEQFLYLTKEIKIIDQIKKINKNSILVGFKLLSGVDDDNLIQVGKAIKDRANCEIVVANKKENITTNKHEAFIIKDDEILKVNTKEEIVNTVIQSLNIVK